MIQLSIKNEGYQYYRYIQIFRLQILGYVLRIGYETK